MEQLRLSRATIPALMTLLLLTAGCATKNALDQDGAIDLKDESLAIIALKITDTHKPKYSPVPKRLYAKKIDKSEDNPGLLILGVPKEAYRKGGSEEAPYSEYLVSMKLKPGEYRMQDIWVESNKFPISGMGAIPISSVFTIQPNSVAYLGRIEAVRRKRQDGEFMAGGPLPLIDQSVSGYSNGTFDVEIVDKYESDTDAFRKTYDALRSQTIEKSMLSPWQRPKYIVR
jgi:hypothetical protein